MDKSKVARFWPTLYKCIYTVSGKNIRNIIDCKSKKCLPILIIFGTNISGKTGHQTTGQFTTSPSVCFCSTWGKMNQQNMH